MRLADCGWKEAASLSQQDASEAFSFITETLALPLLTLKMDIFHPGQEEEGDDHKFVNERLLEVAVPEDPGDGRLITLEECLETYFNNRIEVRRFLERRNTLKSTLSHRPASLSKGNVSHIETVELTESQTPNPVVAKPQSPIVQNSPTRPLGPRARAPSIIREYFTSEKTDGLEMSSSIEEESGFQGRQRAGSIRKEIVLPAWQFFNLIPWYTDNSATNDAQVASHFSSTRPVLGICLKRYSVLANGHAVRRDTHIDIPIDIRLPHFIQDDAMSENGPAFGNFKLSLQSAVCHRGKSVDSGHYVSLVRSQQPDHASLDGSSTGFVSDDSVRERWMRLDDLAHERVAFVEVEDFLRKESPYLLFYQVQPIDDDDFGRVIGTWRSPEADGPPLYTESDSKDSAVTDLSLNYNDSLETTDNSVRSSRPSYDGVTSQREQKSTSLVIESSSSQILAGTSTNSHDTNHVSNLSITNRVTDPNYLTASYGDSRGRLASRGSDKRLSRSLSRLAGKIKKDKIDEPAIAMDGVKDASLPASEGAMFEAPKVNDPNRLKKEHKEKRKHKNIHSTQSGPDGHQHFIKGKQKSEKPDRECSLM